MDACQFCLLRYEPVHRAVAERLLGGDLTDVQIRSRPVDGVNTIAWIVWHMGTWGSATLGSTTAKRW